MLTLLVVIAGALVIMVIAAAVKRRRDSPHDNVRTSGTDDGASSWMFVMSGDGNDGASDCASSDVGSGCDGGGGGGEKAEAPVSESDASLRLGFGTAAKRITDESLAQDLGARMGSHVETGWAVTMMRRDTREAGVHWNCRGCA